MELTAAGVTGVALVACLVASVLVLLSSSADFNRLWAVRLVLCLSFGGFSLGALASSPELWSQWISLPVEILCPTATVLSFGLFHPLSLALVLFSFRAQLTTYG